MRGALLHPTMAMTHWRPTMLFIFLLWCCYLSAVNADFNVTLDDTDPSIIYNPPSSWSQSSHDDFDFDGTHTSTEDPTATATFTFTGTAIYYMAPLWPYRVNTLITLDDLPSVLVDLRDHSRPEVENSPETTQSQVVWSSVGLDNVEHTLVISVGEDENVAIVDGLQYTVSDSTDPTSANPPTTTDTDTSTPPILIPTSSTSSSSLLPTPTTASASSASSKPAGLSTAIGIVCALFGLLALGALLWWWRRRRRRQREGEESMGDLPLPPEMQEASGAGHPMWRTRSARYRDIAAHLGASGPPPVHPQVRGGKGSSGRRRPPPPPHRKPPPVLKKPLTTIPEVSSGLASGTVLTARDVEGGDVDEDAPFAPGHLPAWAEVRLVAPGGSGSGNGALDKEDPWTIRGQ